MIEVCDCIENRISQGDIFKDVEIIENAVIEEKDIVYDIIKLDYVMVITQDCDLDQSFSARKKKEENKNKDNPDWAPNDKDLLSVLVLPIYNAEVFFSGDHLLDLDMKMQKFSKKAQKKFKTNQKARYFYLEFGNDCDLVNSVIDFKHYFTINLTNLEKIMKTKRKYKIKELYREHISQRFANYLSRIGLPNIQEKKLTK